MWAMEKSYFEWRHKHPGRTEYAYLRLALQSRYPLNTGFPRSRLAVGADLDDAILEAVQLDFGDFVVQMLERLWVPLTPLRLETLPSRTSVQRRLRRLPT